MRTALLLAPPKVFTAGSKSTYLANVKIRINVARENESLACFQSSSTLQ